MTILTICLGFSIPPTEQPDDMANREWEAFNSKGKVALLSLASHYRKLHTEFINNGNFILSKRYGTAKLQSRLTKLLGQSKSKRSALSKIIGKVKKTSISKKNFFVILSSIQTQAVSRSYIDIFDDLLCWMDPNCGFVPPTGSGGLPVPPPRPIDPINLCDIVKENAETICSNLEEIFEDCGRGADGTAASVVAQCEINAQMMEQNCLMANAQGAEYVAPVLDYSAVIASICVDFAPSQPETEASEN